MRFARPVVAPENLRLPGHSAFGRKRTEIALEPREAILAWRKDHARRDLERLEQPLVDRIDVEDAVPAVARPEMPVENGRVKIPAFDFVVVQPREPRIEEVVKHLLQVPESRARIEAAGDPEQAYVVPLNESDRGPEILLDLAEDDLRPELVVRVRRRHAVGPVLAGHAGIDAPDAVRVHIEVAPPAEECRRGQPQVGAVGLS